MLNIAIELSEPHKVDDAELQPGTNPTEFEIVPYRE
jgi:hypothetical protein